MSTAKKQVGAKLKGSEDARRTAGVVLDVLAGTLTPHQAAEALGMSPPRYYMVESRALDGLIAGCEPRKRGKAFSEARELEVLRREKQTLERQLVRQQALLRAAHKTAGVVMPKKDEKSGGKRKKGPVVRALKFSQALKQPPGGALDLSAPGQKESQKEG